MILYVKATPGDTRTMCIFKVRILVLFAWFGFISGTVFFCWMPGVGQQAHQILGDFQATNGGGEQ